MRGYVVLEKSKKCPTCKEEIPLIAIRCKNCGYDVRTREEKLPRNDIVSPLLCIVLLVSFLLPWINYKYGHIKGIKGNDYNILKLIFEENHYYDLPTVFIIICIIFIVLTLGIYMSNMAPQFHLNPNNWILYRVRGATAFFAGLSLLIFILPLMRFIRISRESETTIGVGLIFTWICCTGLILSGIFTFLFLYPKFVKTIRSIYKKE